MHPQGVETSAMQMSGMQTCSVQSVQSGPCSACSTALPSIAVAARTGLLLWAAGSPAAAHLKLVQANRHGRGSQRLYGPQYAASQHMSWGGNQCQQAQRFEQACLKCVSLCAPVVAQDAATGGKKRIDTAQESGLCRHNPLGALVKKMHISQDQRKDPVCRWSNMPLKQHGFCSWARHSRFLWFQPPKNPVLPTTQTHTHTYAHTHTWLPAPCA